MSVRTVEQAKQWAAINAAELDRRRLDCDDPNVQGFNKMFPAKSKELWDSSCWLAQELRSLGAEDEQVKQVQFVHGQKAFMGCQWQAAVDLANEYAETGDIADRPGLELADRLIREALEVGEGQ